MKVIHDCCPASRMALVAHKQRTHPDRYNWKIVGTAFRPTFCPWCGCELESVRREESRPQLVGGDRARVS